MVLLAEVDLLSQGKYTPDYRVSGRKFARICHVCTIAKHAKQDGGCNDNSEISTACKSDPEETSRSYAIMYKIERPNVDQRENAGLQQQRRFSNCCEEQVPYAAVLFWNPQTCCTHDSSCCCWVPLVLNGSSPTA